MPRPSLEASPGHEFRLTDRLVPIMSEEQIREYTKESLYLKSAGRFDPSAVNKVLRKNEGRKVWGIDMGGGKATVIKYVVNNGQLVIDKDIPEKDRQETAERNGGDTKNYIPFLEKIGKEAQANGTLIGVSSAGVVEETYLKEAPNMPAFLDILRTKYDSDFKKLLPTAAAVDNDAVATIKTAMMYASREGYLPEGAGEIFMMEPGHVRLLDLYQPAGQKKLDDRCGVFGQKFVCVEKVVGGEAGIQRRWELMTGEKADGKTISQHYLNGNALATSLYETSAICLAEAIKGMENTLGLTDNKAGLILPIVGGGFGGAGVVMDNPNAGSGYKLPVMFHGSGNLVPGYMDRVRQILERGGTSINSGFTGNFSLNAGAEGAAIAALMAEDQQLSRRSLNTQLGVRP